MNNIPHALKRHIEQTTLPTFVRDASRSVVYVNAAAEEYAGTDREDIIGKDCAEVFSDDAFDCSTICPYESLDESSGDETADICHIRRIVHDESGCLIAMHPFPAVMPRVGAESVSIHDVESVINAVSAPVLVVSSRGIVLGMNTAMEHFVGICLTDTLPVSTIMPGYEYTRRLTKPSGTALAETASIATPNGVMTLPIASRTMFVDNGLCLVITLSGPAPHGAAADVSTYQTIAENSSTGIIVYGETITYANPFISRITGMSAEELSTLPVESIFMKEFRPLVRAAASKRLAGERFPGTYEAKIADVHGQERWVLVNGASVHIGGKPAGLIYLVDISLRKILEQKLRESERLFKTLSEYATFGVIVYQDKIIYANTATVSVTGYSKMELYRMEPSAIIHPQDRIEIASAVERRLAGEGTPGTSEVRLIRRDGGSRWIRAYASSINYNGKPSGIVSFIDVSREKELQQSLRKSEALFKNLAEHAVIGVFLCDPDYNIIYTNPRMTDILGMPRNRFSNMQVIESMAVERQDILFDIHQGSLERFDTPRIIEFPIRNINGDIRWLEMLIVGINLDEEPVGLGSVIDVTDRHRYEEHLVSINRSLEQEVMEAERNLDEREKMLIQQSKLATMGEMLGAIAHQWRQPLNGLSIMIQNLRTAYRMEKLNDDLVNEIVDECLESVSFMSNTINDFREFFKPGKQVADFSVATVIRESLSLIRPQIINADIDIAVRLKADDGPAEEICPGEEYGRAEHVRVFGFPSELKQVVLNMLSNAKDAIILGRKDGINGDHVITITIDITTHGQVSLIFDDTGPGIPDSVIDSIFDAYFTTKDDSEGTGIGLYMSKTIIEKNMGGRLTAENGEHGARFTVTVPVVPEEPRHG